MGFPSFISWINTTNKTHINKLKALIILNKWEKLKNVCLRI
jgi:hypothetical protein